MKLKEIDRTVHVAWSPAKSTDPTSHGNYLMTGTAAQQLDASFRSVPARQRCSRKTFDSFVLVPILNWSYFK